jgi:hypothetical protein
VAPHLANDVLSVRRTVRITQNRGMAEGGFGLGPLYVAPRWAGLRLPVLSARKQQLRVHRSQHGGKPR